MTPKSEFFCVYFVLTWCLLNRGACGMVVCLCFFPTLFLLSIASFLSKQANISYVTEKGRTNSSLGFTCLNPSLLFFFAGVSEQR